MKDKTEFRIKSLVRRTSMNIDEKNIVLNRKDSPTWIIEETKSCQFLIKTLFDKDVYYYLTYDDDKVSVSLIGGSENQKWYIVDAESKFNRKAVFIVTSLKYFTGEGDHTMFLTATESGVTLKNNPTPDSAWEVSIIKEDVPEEPKYSPKESVGDFPTKDTTPATFMPSFTPGNINAMYSLWNNKFYFSGGQGNPLNYVLIKLNKQELDEKDGLYVLKNKTNVEGTVKIFHGDTEKDSFKVKTYGNDMLYGKKGERKLYIKLSKKDGVPSIKGWIKNGSLKKTICSINEDQIEASCYATDNSESDLMKYLIQEDVYNKVTMG
jgi:hypothetical protein